MVFREFVKDRKNVMLSAVISSQRMNMEIDELNKRIR